MILLEEAQRAMKRRGDVAQELIAVERPDLLDLFQTYQNEALAARKFLDKNIIELNTGAEILEVGGGILALAIQLASEGFMVTTIEPVGEGFSGISFIMKIFSDLAAKEGVTFKLVELPIEECNFDHKFDFIFSINVMEHLKDPYSVLVQMHGALKPGGKYRFFCPNYDFPYEPHFGKFIVTRKNNAFYLPKHRANSSLIPKKEALGLHGSINFLTLKKLKRNTSGTRIYLSANKSSLFQMIERLNIDSELEKRHKELAVFAKFFFTLKLHHLAKFVPVNYQPVMDVETTLLSF